MTEKSARQAFAPPPESQRGPESGAAARLGFYERRGARLVSLAVVAIGLPLAIAVGALVALCNLVALRDPRKVFFVQERVGHRGRVFRLVKFRTMNEVRDHFSAWAEGDLLRVTRFGRWLRNAHLDELPQLWNVIRGDMNLVGPRPEMIAVEAWAEDAVPGFGRRLAVPPGLTGLAQITQGYTSCDAEAYAEKLAICEDYLRRRSLRVDVGIMLGTAVWMLRGKGWSWNQQGGPISAAGSDGAACEPGSEDSAAA